MCDMQASGNHPLLANNKARNEKYSRLLREFLFAKHMMGEAVTLSSGPTIRSRFVKDQNDMRDFFIDDFCKFETLNIYTKTNVIEQVVVKLPIGTSRTLSLSMIISPIYKLREQLCVDQIVELFFVASFLDTPTRFNETMTRLMTEKHDFCHTITLILFGLTNQFYCSRHGREVHVHVILRVENSYSQFLVPIQKTSIVNNV